MANSRMFKRADKPVERQRGPRYTHIVGGSRGKKFGSLDKALAFAQLIYDTRGIVVSVEPIKR